MPKGFHSKQLDYIERMPESQWRYYCRGEIIKTCRDKKSFDIWVKIHQKNCTHCQKKKLFLKETKIQDASGKLL